MARPRKEIDKQSVRKLACYGLTVSEIAEFLGVSEATIKRRCRKELEEGRAKLKANIRIQQLQAAERGNVAMLIWLGKQYLGQRDYPVNITTDNTRIIIEHVEDANNTEDSRQADEEAGAV